MASTAGWTERLVILAPSPRTLLSALLYTLALPPFDVSHLAWLALVPWLIGLDRARSLAFATVQGVWLAVAVSFGTLHWVVHAAQLEYRWSFVWGVLLLLSLSATLCHPQLVIFSAIYWFITRKVRQGCIGSAFTVPTLALVYCALEWALPKVLNDTLGVAFHRNEYIRQVADLGGPRLLTWLALLANLALADAWRWGAERPPSSGWWRRALRSPLPAVGLLVIAAVAYGWVRVTQVRRELERADHLPVAAIQVNTMRPAGLPAPRGAVRFNVEAMSVLYELSDRALEHRPRPALVVWPENAYRGHYRSPIPGLHGRLDEQLDHWVLSRQMPLIFGGVERSGDKTYNSMFALAPDPKEDGAALQPQIYRKRKLFPLGEWVPGGATLPVLKKIFNPSSKDLDDGHGPPLILRIPAPQSPLGEIKIAPTICYEATYPGLVLDAARLGSQMLLNLSNDAPFGDTAEPHQHLAASVFRSIETRLPMVRATKTGISALVLPDGEIAARTSIGERENLHLSVPVIVPLSSLIRAWGDWFGPFSVIASGALMAWPFRRVRRAAAQERRAKRALGLVPRQGSEHSRS